MSEEVEQEGTWSGLKKTILGTVATVVTAGGAWLGSTLFGGGSEEKAQPAAQPSIIINNTQQQQQAAAAGKTVIIKEGTSGKPATPAQAPKVKKKEGDEFKEQAPQW
jgi:hypothetical protein